MPTNSFLCPHCKKTVELSEALLHEFKEELEIRHKEDLKKVQIEAEKKAKVEFEEKNKLELLDLQKQLETAKQKNDEFRERELELREQARKIEEEKKELKLEVERTLDEERKKMEEKILKEETEKQRFKELEYEKKILDLRKALDEAQRKATQGSQQMQGEILELDLENLLRNTFPTDIVEPVAKGVTGADIKQTVKTMNGNLCGVILWETKRTKAWSDGWITKLKNDLRSEKANVPVIVTTVLPKEAESGMGLVDGVWVCDFKLALPLAEMVRQKLTDVAREKFLAANRGEKAEFLYEYITGHEFRQQVEAIAEVYQDMHTQILKERTAFEKIWKNREAQIQKLFQSTAGIVGSIQGRVGSSANLQIKGIDLLEDGEAN